MTRTICCGESIYVNIAREHHVQWSRAQNAIERRTCTACGSMAGMYSRLNSAPRPPAEQPEKKTSVPSPPRPRP